MITREERATSQSPAGKQEDRVPRGTRSPRGQEPPANSEQAGDGALGREIAQALQPALAEFEHQFVQTIYRELEQALVSDRSQRPSREPPPASEQPKGRGAAQQSRVAPEAEGAEHMATETIQQDQDETQAQNERQARGASQPEQHETARASRGEERRGTEIAPRQRSEMESAGGAGRRAARADRGRRREGYVFDPRAATRVALLNMAHSWMEAGSTYSAIYAYEELLRRYPDGGAAAAATEGIVEIVQTLQQQGKYYTALHVLETLDELL